MSSLIQQRFPSWKDRHGGLVGFVETIVTISEQYQGLVLQTFSLHLEIYKFLDQIRDVRLLTIGTEEISSSCNRLTEYESRYLVEGTELTGVPCRLHDAISICKEFRCFLIMCSIRRMPWKSGDIIALP